MSARPRIVTVAALALIGATALWLSHLRTAVHVGKPGVRLGSLPRAALARGLKTLREG